MNHNTLGNYLETVFALAQHHKWQPSEIENLIPWERDVYVKMLMDFLEEQREKRKQAEQAARSSF
jgi:hypothetical protein